MHRIYSYNPLDLTATDLEALEIELAERLTRRRFITAAGGLLGAAALGACGAGEEAAAPTATTEGTRTVVDLLGREVEVPASPLRIAITSTVVTGDPLIALGIEPIAAPGPFGAEYISHIPDDALDDTMSIGEYRPNLEALAAAEPDLILAFSRDVDDLGVDVLQQIAPTVVAVEHFGDIWEQVQRVADAVGVPERVDDVRVEYERAAAAVDAVTNGESVVFVRPYPEQLASYHDGTIIGPQFEAAGLRLAPPPAGVEPDEFGYAELSLELIPELDGDVMLVWLISMSEEEFREQYLSTPLWQSNPMVAEGRMHILQGSEFKQDYLPLATQETFETLRRVFSE